MNADYKPKNMPGLIPYMTVQDAAKAIEFYKNAFGFEEVGVSYDDNKKPVHVEMRLHDALIMFAPEGVYGMDNKSPIGSGIKAMPLNLYVYCKDVDALYDKAIKAGAKSKMAPNDGFWGDRYCALVDPDGYEWSFATHLGRS